MIDLKVTSAGGPEIARALSKADTGIRESIRAELAQIGNEIVSAAQASAPKRTGIMAAKIIWYFGTRAPRTRKGKSVGTQVRDINWKDGRIRFEAAPTGRVAHLMERGVHASFNQRTGKRGRDQVRPGRHLVGPYGGEAVQGPTYRYARTLNIAPRPFFMPAVESMGGPAGVNSRLQSKIDRLAAALNSGGA